MFVLVFSIVFITFRPISGAVAVYKILLLGANLRKSDKYNACINIMSVREFSSCFQYLFSNLDEIECKETEINPV